MNKILIFESYGICVVGTLIKKDGKIYTISVIYDQSQVSKSGEKINLHEDFLEHTITPLTKDK